MTLTPERLDEIDAAIAKATPREWRNDADWPEVICDHEGGSLGEMTQGFPSDIGDADNGRLVVLLHNAAPSLTAAARRCQELEGENEKLKADLAYIAKTWPDSFAARSARAALTGAA